MAFGETLTLGHFGEQQETPEQRIQSDREIAFLAGLCARPGEDPRVGLRAIARAVRANLKTLSTGRAAR